MNAVEQLDVWLLSFVITFAAVVFLPRKISNLYRRRRGDTRVAKNFAGYVHCPRCNEIVEGVFHEKCEASPLKHLHWICGTCKNDYVVKP